MEAIFSFLLIYYHEKWKSVSVPLKKQRAHPTPCEECGYGRASIGPILRPLKKVASEGRQRGEKKVLPCWSAAVLPQINRAKDIGMTDG